MNRNNHYYYNDMHLYGACYTSNFIKILNKQNKYE